MMVIESVYREAVDETIASRLSTVRKAQGISQEGLARLTGLSRQTIADIEAGRTPSPIEDTVRRLAQALRVSPRWLQYGYESPETGDYPPLEILLRNSEGLSDEHVSIVRRIVDALRLEESAERVRLEKLAKEYDEREDSSG